MTEALSATIDAHSESSNQKGARPKAHDPKGAKEDEELEIETQRRASRDRVLTDSFDVDFYGD